MTESSTDRIHKEITLRAPRSRVWRALADSAEFGEWFGVRMDAPFRVGEWARGRVTHPGYEHVTFEIQVERMETEESFVFRWHPAAIDPEVDYSSEPTTLVEIRLTAAGDGTLLTVTESGFDALPPGRRRDAFRMNEAGWTAQIGNIEKHVDG